MSKVKSEDSKYDKLATGLKSMSYFETLGAIRDSIGLPVKTTHAEMEALLIFIVKDIFPGSIEADVSLMALGLLKGFYRPNGRDDTRAEKMQYSERLDKFLDYTNYVSVISEGRFNSSAEARKEKRPDRNKQANKRTERTEFDTIRDTLGSDSTRYIKQAISTLHDRKERLDDYLNEAKTFLDEYAKEIRMPKLNWKNFTHMPEQLLPTLQCLNLITPEREVIPDNPGDQSGKPETTTDGLNKPRQTLEQIQDAVLKIRSLLGAAPKVSSVWVIALGSLFVLNALSRCSGSFTTTHYIYRENGVEFIQNALSFGPPREEIKPIDIPVDIDTAFSQAPESFD